MTMQMSEMEIAQWRDRKRYLWLMGLIAPPTALFVMLPLVWAFNEWGGWHVAAQVPFWIGPILLYILLPALDLKFGPDGQNPPDEVMERLEKRQVLPLLHLPLHPVPVRQRGRRRLPVHRVGPELARVRRRAGLAGQDRPGAVGRPARRGSASTPRTRWGHKKDSLERWLAKITLAQTCYGHFYIEHNRGHHVRVATPRRTRRRRGSARRSGSSCPRSVFGSLKSAWELEAKRLDRAGKSKWHWSNDVLNAWAMSAVFYGVLIAVFGWALLPYIVISAIFGFTLLETVNYLEHYGLLRQKLDSGRYERCAPPVHSWNSDHIVTNLFLYHLQRHSDHHANPTRRYQTLRSMDGAPNLPSGYASMIALTYFPPLWRKVMDHRVLEHYDGDLSRVNIHPPRVRDKVVARYGAGDERLREERGA